MWYGSSMNQFGQMLREERMKKGMTLRDVERRVHVSRQTVLRAERGLFVSLDVTTKLLEAFRIRGEDRMKLLELYLKQHILSTKAAKKLKLPVAVEPRA